MTRIASSLLVAVCVAASIASVVADGELIASLKTEVATLAVTAPPNAASYVNGITATGAYNGKSVAAAGLNDVLTNEWKLPAEVVTKFQQITLASSVVFQTFNLVVKNGQGALDEFVGAARNPGNGANLELAYILVHSTGNLIGQTQTVDVRKCHHCWVVGHCCHTEHQQQPRGFTAPELAVIEQALRAAAYSHLNDEINKQPVLFTHFDQIINGVNADLLAVAAAPSSDVVALTASDESESLLAKAIKALLAKFPELKKDLETKTKTEVVNKIVGRGFTEFEQSASISKIDGVMESVVPAFITQLKSQIALPAAFERDFESTLSSILYSDSNTWVVFRVAFSAGTGGDCKYVSVLARHDTEAKKVDWLISDVSAKFALAPDLFVVRTSKSALGGLFKYSEDKVKLVPRSITSDDLDCLFSFFDIIAFQRFAEIMHIAQPSAPLLALGAAPTNALTAATNTSGGTDLLSSAISALIAKWPEIAKAFATSTSSTIIKQIEGRGFSHFEESAQMQKIDGMVSSHLDFFKAELRDRLRVPEKYAKDFEYVLGDIEFMDASTWVAFDVLFDMNSGGTCKYVSVLARHDPDAAKVDWLIADVQATFQLAPDVMIIRQSKSIAGGIFSSTTDKIKYVPRGITNEDLEQVFNFFLISAYKRVADVLGIMATNPDIPAPAAPAPAPAAPARAWALAAAREPESVAAVAAPSTAAAPGQGSGSWMFAYIGIGAGLALCAALATVYAVQKKRQADRQAKIDSLLSGAYNDLSA